MGEHTDAFIKEPHGLHDHISEDREEKQKDGIELERKFYLQQPPEGYKDNPVAYIVQGYTADKPAIRYRIKRTLRDDTWTDRYYQTVKTRHENPDQPGQHEKQMELDEEAFKKGWETITKSVAKMRWNIPFGKHKVELDRYFDNGGTDPQTLPERFFNAVTTAHAQQTDVDCPMGDTFMAEIEYGSQIEYTAGLKPDWLENSKNVQEVTNERWASNSRIAEAKNISPQVRK